MNLEEIREHHSKVDGEVTERLEEFRELRDASEYRWFMELCFVICSSQTEGQKAWEAVEDLDEKNLLAEGNKEQISKVLASHGVSYEENKAGYIVTNREELSQPTLSNPTRELRLKDRLDLENPGKAREWLAENMKGVGMKGSSHFLRNVGYSSEFAILSGHILSVLSELGYLEDASTPEGVEDYLEKEKNFMELSEELDIDPGALDLVLWSFRTGEVFK